MRGLVTRFAAACCHYIVSRGMPLSDGTKWPWPLLCLCSEVIWGFPPACSCTVLYSARLSRSEHCSTYAASGYFVRPLCKKTLGSLWGDFSGAFFEIDF